MELPAAPKAPAVSAAPAAASTSNGSLWEPLTVSAFRALWIATVLSNIGTAMQGVGATWLMVSEDARPTMVASLQAAASLPMFIFGLPAGVLADIVDRRRLLIGASLWMMAVSVALAVVTYLGLITPMGLIVGTFALGIGAAMTAPAFQAVVPDLVPAKLLTPAVTLNGIGNNVAKTIGPAVGGVFVGMAGSAATFAVNAASTVAVVLALWLWKNTPQSSRLPPEHFFSALRASVRYVSAARGIRVVLARTVLFFAFASAFNALLPIVVSQRLHLGADGFGLVLGAIGVGSVGGALVLSKLRAKLGLEHLTRSATLLVGLSTLALGWANSPWLACLAAAAFGVGWIANLTLLNVGVQNTVAGWVRARMLAMYVVTFMGVTAAGSLLWGKLSEGWSLQAALTCAGVLQAVSILALWRVPFVDSSQLDLHAAASSEAQLVLDPTHDLEPVMVTVEYTVPQLQQDAFSYALWGLENARRRAGAMTWRHWRDQDTPTIHRESFAVDSWTDYLRLTSRKTVADTQLEQAVLGLLSPGTAPRQQLFRGVKRVGWIAVKQNATSGGTS